MYNFRPMDLEFYKTCAKTDFCTDCPQRAGCQIRYEFYIKDLSYETYLQLAEVYIISKLHVPDDATLKASNHMRSKRERELMLKPRFSYT